MAEGIINLFSALNTDTISNSSNNAEVASLEKTTIKTTTSATTNLATSSTTTTSITTTTNTSMNVISSTSKSISSMMKLGIDDKNYDNDNYDHNNNHNSTTLIEDENDFIDYHEIMKEEYEHNDTRIAMIGNVDSGKSTLIGVLTNSLLDDGRGCARSLVLKHRHEQDNGRTSAVTVEIMGYKGDEQVISNARNHSHRWMEIMEKSEKTVSFFHNSDDNYDDDYDSDDSDSDSGDDINDDNDVELYYLCITTIY